MKVEHNPVTQQSNFRLYNKMACTSTCDQLCGNVPADISLNTSSIGTANIQCAAICDATIIDALNFGPNVVINDFPAIILSTTYAHTRVITDYQATVSDEYIGVDTSIMAITITLPEISTLGTPNNHKLYTITDEGGNALANNITIATSGGDTIIGQPSVVLNDNYNSISIYSDGTTEWFLK